MGYKKTIKIGKIVLIIFLILSFVFVCSETIKAKHIIAKLEKATKIISSVQINSKEISALLPSKNKKATRKKSVSAPKHKFNTLATQSKDKKFIHLPILMYHHINVLPPKTSQVLQKLTVSPQIFEAQMRYLFEKNYQPISFKQFIDFLKIGKKIPKKSLIITFDDGWKNQYIYAFPVLKKYKFPATFFIVTKQIGGNLFMSWTQLKTLLANGMEIGSHTVNHPNLRQLKPSQLTIEIKNSKTILEKNLNYQVEVFCYPYGVFDSKIIEMVRSSGYKAARTVIRGVDQNIKNMYTLRAIQSYNNLDQIKKIFP